MRSSRLRNTKPQDDAGGVRWDPHAGKHRLGSLIKDILPAVKRHRSNKEGNCWIIPPLRGDSGGCALLFWSFFFSQYWYFQDKLTDLVRNASGQSMCWTWLRIWSYLWNKQKNKLKKRRLDFSTNNNLKRILKAKEDYRNGKRRSINWFQS